MSLTIDRRNHPRKTISIPIKCQIDGKQYDTRTLNLSQDGLMIQMDNFIESGKEIHIDLPLSEKEPIIKVKGIAVWQKDKTSDINNLKVWNLGVKFIYIDTSSHLKIIEYLKEVEINKIIIFTLDSLYANIAVRKLIKNFHKQIKLICLSQRFSKKRGSFIKQTLKTIKKSGLGFTNYLGFYLVYHNFFIYLTGLFNKLFFKKNEILTIKEWAKKYSIPIYVTDNINSKESRKHLIYYQPDLIISSHFDQKINKDIIAIPRYGCINLHYALLPEFRGPFPSFWGVLEGKEVLGTTIHYMDEEFDEGDIIQQEEIKIRPNDSILSIDCHLLNIGADLIIKVLEKIETGTVVRFKQKDLRQGSYYSFPTKKEIRELRRKNIKIFNFSDYLKHLKG